MSSESRNRQHPYGRTRYDKPEFVEFWKPVNEALGSARVVLDVGSGRRPTVSPRERPAGLQYVGLDSSAEELSLAAAGSYDETVAASAEQFVPELADRFDLIVSFGVLEHLQDLPAAARNMFSYLKPGGTFVGYLSGKNAVFAIANRILPWWFGRRLVAVVRRRDLDTVFPAHYDHCDATGLREVFSKWGELEVVPLWEGAIYFVSFPRLLDLYLWYEDLAARKNWERLATHYVVIARRAAGGG